MKAQLIILYACLLIAGCSTASPPPDQPHHTEQGFRNLYPIDSNSFFDFMKWRWQRLWHGVPGPEAYDFTPATPDLERIQGGHEGVMITWIGHATLLLQLNGKNILTDPQFSQRASPLSWAGPQRVIAPAPALSALPPIDVVIISHDHYDSLDLNSIKRLHERDRGNETLFVVPLGLAQWFRDLGISKVVELDWWQQHGVDDLAFTAVPAQHWSKRSPWGRNKTLWAGWVVQTTDFRFLFVGDSGYAPHFQEIGRRLGPFDLAAIPIGAYEPAWFMHSVHLNPEEAVQTHLDVNARQSVAIHWGTFILTDEPLDEPPLRLEQARRQAGLPAAAFRVLRHGESLMLK